MRSFGVRSCDEGETSGGNQAGGRPYHDYDAGGEDQ
jgi:hypothetical protein